jgi:uncharacterized membrane protein YbhN (UPF0104 family)
MDEFVAVTLLLQSGMSVVTVMTFDIVEAVVLVHVIWYVLNISITVIVAYKLFIKEIINYYLEDFNNYIVEN